MKGLSRNDAQNIVRSLGGDVVSSVSKDTSFIVSGENAGSKLYKARELGITIISEQDFLNMVK